jgi:hypothetical protein
MSYPTIDRALRDILRSELRENPLCRKVVRKAQAHGAIAKDVGRLAGTIWGTFSAHNDFSLGWRERLRYQEQAYFSLRGG